MIKVLELPDELAAKVKDIPDLDERIVRFIKAEAVWYEQRQKRFSQETLDVSMAGGTATSRAACLRHLPDAGEFCDSDCVADFVLMHTEAVA